VTVVIFGHLNRSLYLLTYLLNELLEYLNVPYFISKEKDDEYDDKE